MSANEPSLETVTSVDELLQLLYPEYSLLQHCLKKKSWLGAPSSPSVPTSSSSPSVHYGDEDLWGQPLREESLYNVKDVGTLGGGYLDTGRECKQAGRVRSHIKGIVWDF